MASSTTSVITAARRRNLAKITRGAVDTIPPVTHIAFGDGGLDREGQPVQPEETWQELGHEVGRFAIDGVACPVETTNRYTVTIPEDKLNGVSISEMALVDGDGVFAAVKTFLPKGKDSDVTFMFEFDDVF